MEFVINKKKHKTYRIWTEEEIYWFENNYQNLTNDEISSKLNRTIASLTLKATSLGLTKNKNCDSEYANNSLNNLWSDTELHILKDNFGKIHPDDMKQLLPKRSWLSIRRKANMLGIYFRNLDVNYETNNNLDVLLNESVESYYWLGFLMADGHFSENSIQVNLAIKDKKHLEKFAKYIGLSGVKEIISNNFRTVRVSTKNHEIVQELRRRFKIDNNKTKNPCNLESLDIFSDKAFSLAIGYIDGDGSMKLTDKSNRVIIQCHESWLYNLNIFAKILQFPDVAHINKSGLASIAFNNHEKLKIMKAKAFQLKLPVLLRKWDRINSLYIPKKSIDF